MAGTIKTNVQLGDSPTASNNFMLSAQTADGKLKLSRGNDGATTQDIITVDAAGKLTLTQGLPAISLTALPSMIRVNTANGYGSTNTAIRRFTNIVTNQGSDITYADSATLGASFTINTNGVYNISYNDQFNVAQYLGVTLNSTQLTTPIVSLTNASEIVCITSSSSTNVGSSTSTTIYLPAGSVLRAHVNGAATSGTNVIACQFTITRVA